MMSKRTSHDGHLLPLNIHEFCWIQFSLFENFYSIDVYFGWHALRPLRAAWCQLGTEQELTRGTTGG